MGQPLRSFLLLALLAACDDAAAPSDAAVPVEPGDLGAPPCPEGMAQIIEPDADARFCVDRWEAHAVEVDADGGERTHSPFLVVDGLRVRARSAAGVYPQ